MLNVGQSWLKHCSQSFSFKISLILFYLIELFFLVTIPAHNTIRFHVYVKLLAKTKYTWVWKNGENSPDTLKGYASPDLDYWWCALLFNVSLFIFVALEGGETSTYFVCMRDLLPAHAIWFYDGALWIVSAVCAVANQRPFWKLNK